MDKCYFSRVAHFTKVTLLHGCFSRFQNCTNGIKLCKALHMALAPGSFAAEKPLECQG